MNRRKDLVAAFFCKDKRLREESFIYHSWFIKAELKMSFRWGLKQNPSSCCLCFCIEIRVAWWGSPESKADQTSSYLLGRMGKAILTLYWLKLYGV